MKPSPSFLSRHDRVGSLDGADEMRFSVESVFDMAPVGLCVLDLNFRYLQVNACFARMYNLTKADIVGKTVEEALPGPAPQILAHLREAFSVDGVVEREITLPNPASNNVDDSVVYLRTAQPLRNERGVVYGFSVATSDITARKRSEKQFGEVEEDLRFTIELTPHVPWQCDASGELIFMSHRWNSITGTTGTVGLKEWAEVLHPDDLPSTTAIWAKSVKSGEPYDAEYRIRSKDGDWRWVRARAYPRRSADGEIVRWYGTVEDVHDRKIITMQLEKVTEALARLAREDYLTGLPNRRFFDEVLSREIGRARRNKGSVSLIMLDIDHFKRYNDIAGHLQGDACLREVAKAIRRSIRRPADMAARFGGEEFAVLLPDTPLTGACEVARKISAEVQRLTFAHLESSVRQVTVSAGVATIESAAILDATASAGALIAAADQALYNAKASGRNAIISKLAGVPTNHRV